MEFGCSMWGTEVVGLGTVLDLIIVSQERSENKGGLSRKLTKICLILSLQIKMIVIV